jgi:hypothetical protein
VSSRDAIVDLLGVLAYAELCGFDRLAADARMAPTLAGRADMSGMAAVELGRYLTLADRLRELGVAPEDAMAPFVTPLENYHSLTSPSTWLEGIVKAYIGGGLANDFYLEVARYVDDPTRELIEGVLADVGQGEFAVREVRTAVAANPGQADRLALWGRRLVGEAISQAQHVLAERDSLMLLLVEGGGDLSGVAGLIGRITERHSERMATLGLRG